MTPSERNVVKLIAVVIFVIALVPLGAFGYRILANTELDTQAVPTPPLFTLVPASTNDLAFMTPTPTQFVIVLPSGYTEHIVAEHGFAVAVPSSWQPLPVKQQELDAALQVIRQSNPELAAVLGARGQQLMQNGVRFWAVDLKPESLQNKFATNLTITRRTLPNEVSFDAYIAVNLNQVNELASRQGEVTHERAALSNRPAEKVRYNLVFQAEDGTEVTSAITQYLLLNRNDAYVLTYATRVEQAEEYALTFEQSAATFRLLGQ